MIPYAQHRPTQFDCRGLGLPDRQGWLVHPISQTRDSGAPDRSNFAVLCRELERVDPAGNDHEVHRFGHWVPGWYEIVIVRPDTAAAREAEGLTTDDYPILDERHLSNVEQQDEHAAWDAYAARDLRRALRAEYPHAPDRWDIIPNEILASAYYAASDAADVYVEHTDEGPSFDFERVIAKADMRSFILQALRDRRDIAKNV